MAVDFGPRAQAVVRASAGSTRGSPFAEKRPDSATLSRRPTENSAERAGGRDHPARWPDRRRHGPGVFGASSNASRTSPVTQIDPATALELLDLLEDTHGSSPPTQCRHHLARRQSASSSPPPSPPGCSRASQATTRSAPCPGGMPHNVTIEMDLRPVAGRPARLIRRTVEILLPHLHRTSSPKP